MSKQDVIWLEGERELYINLQRRMDTNTTAARKALRSVGLQIVNDAKENLRANDSVATGQLRASGKVQKVDGDPDAFDAGFFTKKSGDGYAACVEYGTKAGGKRTIGFLIPIITAWLKKKTSVGRGMKSAFASAAAFSGMSADKYLRQIAFFISRKIVRMGTKPHPYFRPALEKNEQAITDAIAEAVNDDNNGK